MTDWSGRLDALSALLAALPPAEIMQVDQIFRECSVRAYSWDLWGAAVILGAGGCSDDAFRDFRSWLISLGKEVYEKALHDPDSLAEVAIGPNPGEEEDAFFEEFAYVAADVYEELTGQREMPSSDQSPAYPEKPFGIEWDEDDLPKRYPKLWAANEHLM